MRTVFSPISFATGAIRRSTEPEGATSTTALSPAAGRPSIDDGNWSAARAGAGSFMVPPIARREYFGTGGATPGTHLPPIPLPASMQYPGIGKPVLARGAPPPRFL